jgi:hypothetical protein
MVAYDGIELRHRNRAAGAASPNEMMPVFPANNLPRLVLVIIARREPET